MFNGIPISREIGTYGDLNSEFACGIGGARVHYSNIKGGPAMGRRTFTAEQKMSIVLQGIKGETSVAELCRNHAISQVQYYKWRDLFFEGAKRRLNGKLHHTDSTVEKAKIKELERIIGRQTITIEILKKIQNVPEI